MQQITRYSKISGLVLKGKSNNGTMKQCMFRKRNPKRLMLFFFFLSSGFYYHCADIGLKGYHAQEEVHVIYSKTTQIFVRFIKQ